MLRDELERLSYKCKPTEYCKKEAFMKQYALPVIEKEKEDGQNTGKL